MVKTLQEQISGVVLTPDSPEYDGARAVWNAMVDRKPRLIARCSDAYDVAATIRYARDHDLEIGVRSGGHSVIGHAIADDGLVIDLTMMNEVTVDPAQRRARVAGGALLGALDRASLAHDLATTAGNVSHTGAGGLTLGGGMGWLARQHGLSCDNVASFEVVTADGKAVCASATENPDLYWALRGGGGNFGVVTAFEFHLHPLTGGAVIADLTFSLDSAAAALRGWRDLALTAPRQATLTAWIGGPQPHTKVGFVWVGAPDGSADLLAALRPVGTPVDEQVQRVSYLDLQRMDDDVEGHAYRRYWKGHYFRELSDAAIDAFVLRGTADGRGEFLPNASFQAYGGAISDVPDDATAFSHRDAFAEFVASSKWTDPAEDDARIAASRRYATSLAPFASGAYVNALTDEGSAGVQRAYSPEKVTRLTAAKDAWDPDNVFHLNHNIVPSTAS